MKIRGGGTEGERVSVSGQLSPSDVPVAFRLPGGQGDAQRRRERGPSVAVHRAGGVAAGQHPSRDGTREPPPGHHSGRLTNTSPAVFPSSSTSWAASETNATDVPSAERDEVEEAPAPSPPNVRREARKVRATAVSRTKMSSIAFSSPGTRFPAVDVKLTKRPSSETEGLKHWPE